MRPWLLAFLMLVLPLQTAWAAVASLCAHAAGAPVAAHFGHHEHKHAQSDAIDGSDAGATVGHDADCGTCHGAGSASLPAPLTLRLALPTAAREATPYRSWHRDRAPDSPLKPPRFFAG